MHLTEEQHAALLNCAELIKDIANAADAGNPYTVEELLPECWLALNNLVRAGVRLSGEDF